jgi:alkylated DNA repair dioxygenase AlkB
MNTFNVDLYENFLTKKESKFLFEFFENLNWKKDKKRESKTFGDENLEYVIHWFGKTTVRKAIIWPKEILEIKSRLEEFAKEKFTVLVVQRYPDGKSRINPHRDKEMTRGTTICGISLGATRTLRLEKGENYADLELKTGSLYMLKPPTNDYWSHAILKDDSKDVRISLTFRNYSSKK